MENSLQCAVITPFAEAAVDRLPGTIAFRQVAPGSPTLCNPQDCMKNHTLIFRGGASSLRRWKEMLYLIPLVIAYFITLNWHFMYYYNFLLAYIILPIYAMESFQTRPSSGKRMHISLETEDFSFARSFTLSKR